VKQAGKQGAYAERTVEGDFDGDTQVDMLHTDPYFDCGKGRLIEILDDDTAREWGRDTTGVLGTAACDDHLGADVVVADFDGDGYDDVAATAPGSAVSGEVQAGSVTVLYGTSAGLSASGDQLLHQDSTGILGTAEDYDFFGESAVGGDFNCDGIADLVPGGEAEYARLEAEHDALAEGAGP
jgi:hypothetical protein